MEELNQIELELRMKEILEKYPNTLIFVKFTCEYCGSGQTCDTPNAIFLKGYSCENCGKINYPKKFGMLLFHSNF